MVDLIAKRGMSIDSRCQLCGLEGESINHVFFSYTLARQVWAMSNIPSPENGFDGNALFSNFSFLMKVYKNSSILLVNRRLILWLMWFIWKNRNGWLFESVMFLALDVIKKACDERDQWVAAQVVESSIQEVAIVSDPKIPKKWSRPHDSWVKCNVGLSWSKKNQMVGGSWVLRDDRGVVILHSRRYFAKQACLEDVKLLVLIWAMESIGFHKINNIIFAFEYEDLVGAVERPMAWPSFSYQSDELLKVLERFSSYKLVLETRSK